MYTLVGVYIEEEARHRRMHDTLARGALGMYFAFATLQHFAKKKVMRALVLVIDPLKSALILDLP